MAESILGSWEPEPSLGFAKNYIVQTVLVSLGQATGKRGQSETNEFRSLRRVMTHFSVFPTPEFFCSPNAHSCNAGKANCRSLCSYMHFLM
jgi:hypothetical protein